MYWEGELIWGNGVEKGLDKTDEVEDVESIRVQNMLMRLRQFLHSLGKCESWLDGQNISAKWKEIYHPVVIPSKSPCSEHNKWRITMS